MRTCSIDGCEKKTLARGWCSKHYQRWQKHGDPLGGNTRYSDPNAAFLARTEPLVGDPGCVVWIGTLDGDGYGLLKVDGRVVLAHRYAWEQECGPIPEGMVIDHTCWERSCVNVDHLRLATVAQNNAYLSGPRRGRKHDLPRGVARNGKGYMARVGVNGKLLYLGTHATPDLASIAAENARSIHFGEYAGAN